MTSDGLMQSYGDGKKLIIIVSARELRKSSARMNAGLSWEETVEGFFRELPHHADDLRFLVAFHRDERRARPNDRLQIPQRAFRQKRRCRSKIDGGLIHRMRLKACGIISQFKEIIQEPRSGDTFMLEPDRDKR